MNDTTDSELPQESRRASSQYPLSIIAISLTSIVLTYVLAKSTLDASAKTSGFSVIIASLLVVCVAHYFLQSRRKSPHEIADPGEISADDIDRALMELDEANEFFTGAHRPTDTFRLIASRLRGLCSFQAIALLLLDEMRKGLTVAEADGFGVENQKGRPIGFDDHLAGKSFESKTVEFGNESPSEGEPALPSVAIPLARGTEVFGVIQLFFEMGHQPLTTRASIFEAIGTRIAPLVLRSIAYEQSQANALTDAITALPNERAFYLILENQIAEATRKQGNRPLTILTIDIKNFDDINRRFGHASGDTALKYVAKTIKENLRQMDFFARSLNDEFLAILPTASKEISHEVIARINSAFCDGKLKLSDRDAVEIDLNFGWAAFGIDGETGEQLLRVARLRKEQAKSTAPRKVLEFRRELVN